MKENGTKNRFKLIPVYITKAKDNVKLHVQKEKTSIKKAFLQNFCYGLTGVMVPVSILIGHIFVILVSLYIYYSVLSMVVNREKYLSNLGKYFYFPFPSMLGGATSYYLGEYIKTIL